MNKIVCFSASGGYALENFRKTVATTVETDELLNVAGQDLPSIEMDQLSVWAMRETERNRILWNKIERGDMVLFYSKDTFISYGTVLNKAVSSAVGNFLWNNSRYNHLVLMAPHREVKSHRQHFWTVFQYSNSATIQGMMIPRIDIQQKLLSKYHDVTGVADYLLSLDHTVESGPGRQAVE